MAFAPGDPVHLPRIGTGVVRQVRNARCVVEIKGRTLIVDVAQLERADRAVRVPDRPREESAASADENSELPHRARTLDLHGRTAAEAVEALDDCLNEALLAGETTVRVIHGRSGGRVKAAVHARLRAVPAVQRFAIDPRNPGVTIVSL